MKNTSIWLICSVALIFSFGLLMVFNTTSAEILERTVDGSTHAPLLRQFLYGAIGIFAGLLVYFLGYEFLLKYSHILLGITVCLLLLLYLPGLGQTINGSRRWLGFAGFSFQPSEC